MDLTFGEKIRNLREDAGLTQAQLADKLNMTQRKISYIERNRYEPSIGDLIVLCKFFHTSADYLIGLTK